MPHVNCVVVIWQATTSVIPAGDFIVDDDGMGYADIGEEEDWGRSDQKGAREADGHATSKKTKDGSTAGQLADIEGRVLPAFFSCSKSFPNKLLDDFRSERQQKEER